MQNLEWLLVTASLLYIVFNRPINRKLAKNHVLGMLFTVLGFHLIFEGYRWQMFPAYLIWIIALITAIKRTEKKSSTLVKVLKYVGLAILLLPAIALPSVLPVFELPEPTGSFTVGTRDIQLDLNREEIITADPADNRILMIKAFYPSNQTDGQMDPYVDKGGRNGFAQKYGLPISFLNYLDKVDTHVYRDIQITDASFPVLIFSHGYNSKANGYYALLSEIASQGYIIFSINHNFESTGTTFPDGSETYFDYGYAQEIESGTWESMSPLVDAFKNGLPFEERHPIVKEALLNYFVRGMVERWTEDILDVERSLDSWNDTGFFKGKLDLSKIGVFGHSRGGGAAGNSLLKESRISAGANLDGVQWGHIVNTTFQKPFLFVAADWPAEHENLPQHAYVNKGTSYFYDAMILESGHSNFMDIPFMIPLQTLSQAGSIDPDLGMEITTRTVSSFFDKHLKQNDIDLSVLGVEYDMLNLTVYEGDSVK